MADGFEAAAPAVATIFRRCASDPLALSLIPDKPTWDSPHRLLAGVRWLALSGEVDDFEAADDPWRPFRAVLETQAEWLSSFVREHPVQPNEVQRCWVLVPIFLTVARLVRRPLDLVELGTSAGLNLLWDRYGYRYRAGSWGMRRHLFSSPERSDASCRARSWTSRLTSDVASASISTRST